MEVAEENSAVKHRMQQCFTYMKRQQKISFNSWPWFPMASRSLPTATQGYSPTYMPLMHNGRTLPFPKEHRYSSGVGQLPYVTQA